MAKSNRLSEIKTGAISRGLALAKLTATAGAKAAGHTLGTLFASENERADKLKGLLLSQAGVLTKELGQLKGSLMKVGQMLSMFGEHFLPPEANAVLKSLQNQSPPLDWPAIEKALHKQLGSKKLELLEVHKEPLASASLGQVHLAKIKSTGQKLAMKIQYPGVDKAIDSDLKALKSLLSLAKIIPKGPNYDNLFREVSRMLHQEVDYKRELEITIEMRKALGEDKRYVVPEVFPEFSTSRILATSYEEGFAVDSLEVSALSQTRRNAIGEAAMDLYFRELFEFGKVQTDPHFGNYRIRIDRSGTQDQIVLLDFGAVRSLTKKFLIPYLDMVRGSVLPDRQLMERGSRAIGFLQEGDSDHIKNIFFDFCELITEPFAEPHSRNAPPASLMGENGVYDWGKSDLPKRVAKKAAELALAAKLRTPPEEIVFLDRKMGGIFIFLSALKVKLRGRELLTKYF